MQPNLDMLNPTLDELQDLFEPMDGKPTCRGFIWPTHYSTHYPAHDVWATHLWKWYQKGSTHQHGVGLFEIDNFAIWLFCTQDDVVAWKMVDLGFLSSQPFYICVQVKIEHETLFNIDEVLSTHPW